MISSEVHTEVHVRKQFQGPAYCTCFECHRSFHAKSVDQLSLLLCDSCFDAVRHGSEPVVNIHVKVRPHRTNPL